MKSTEGADNRQPFKDEFKIRAVRQIREGGYPVQEVAVLRGDKTKSLCHWKAWFGRSSAEYQKEKSAQDELMKLGFHRRD